MKAIHHLSSIHPLVNSPSKSTQLILDGVKLRDSAENIQVQEYEACDEQIAFYVSNN